MNGNASAIRIVAGTVVAGGLVLAASAQTIVSDGTVGTSVTLNGKTHEITDGTKRGSNLFHSFSRFDVDTGFSAEFINTVGGDISNILSRVTGGSESNIDGLIKSSIPGANLFLINPYGIVFGPNASLDVSGSFHASTADELRFNDGTLFSATDLGASTFTSAPPEAFGFLPNNVGELSVEESELKVPNEQNLSFIGNPVTIVSGQLTAEAGEISIVTVDESREVPIKSGVDNLPLAQTRGRIMVQDRAIDAGSADDADIRIVGGRVKIDNSEIEVNNEMAPGQGIIIDADTLVLTNFALLSTEAQGDAPGGHISIRAAEVVRVMGGSIIAARTGGQSDAGNVWITAPRLELSDGARVESSTADAGGAGDITINATRGVSLTAGGAITTENGFTPSNGPAGNISITTGTLDLSERFSISSSSISDANAGKIKLEATEGITLEGKSDISSLTDTGMGDGGNISITNTKTLELRNSSIISDSSGAGDAGDINVTTSDGITLIGDVSTISSSALYVGDAGDLSIMAKRLEVRDGARITASTSGAGKGGNVTIQASRVNVEGAGSDGTPSAISTESTPAPDVPKPGDAGTITIQAKELTLRDRAQITASTAGAGKGGEITVKEADRVVIRDGGEISAKTSGSGKGGTITIRAAKLRLDERGVITAQSEGSGDAGDIIIEGVDTFQIFNDSGVRTKATEADGGNIKVKARKLVHLVDSEITTSVEQGAGTGGNITIDPEIVILENGKIIASAVGGPGGNILIVADHFIATPDSLVDASSEENIDGDVEIDSETDIRGAITVLPESFLDTSGLLTEPCAARAAGRASSLVSTGRGGLPVDPDGYLPDFNPGLPQADEASNAAAGQGPQVSETWPGNSKAIALAKGGLACNE